MRLKLFSSLTIIFLLTACASSRMRAGGSALNLDAVDQIELGKAQSSDLVSAFGNPSRKVSVQKTQMEAWLYCDEQPCIQGRLTAHIEPSSGLVKKIIWNTQSADPLRNLDEALSRYQGSAFSMKKVLVNYGSYLYTWTAYEAPEKGILISYDDQKKLVGSITRVAPMSQQELVQTNSTGHPVVTLIPDPKTAVNP